MENLEPQSKELMLVRRVAIFCFATGFIISALLGLNRSGWLFQFDQVIRSGGASPTLIVPAILALATLLVYFSQNSLRIVRAVVYLMALFLLLFIGTKGAISLNYSAVALVLILLAAPERYRLAVGVGSMAVICLVSFIAPTEIEWSLHLRLMLFNAALVWPLVTLFGSDCALEERKKRALEQLILASGCVAGLIIVFEPTAIHGLPAAIAAILLWRWLRSAPQVSQRTRLLLFTLGSAIFAVQLWNAGQVAAQSLCLFLLLSFLVATPRIAVTIASVFLLLVLYALLHFEPELVVSLAARTLIGGLMLIVALYAWSSASTKRFTVAAEVLAISEQLKNLVLSISVVVAAFTLLYIPLGDALKHAFAGEPEAFWSWLLMSLAIACLSVWLLTLYLNSQQLQLRANTQLRELNEDLKAQRQMIEAQQEQQNHMFSVIGHELRAPIAALQMLFEKVAPYALGRERSAIQGNLRQAMQVLDDLRLVAQPETALVEENESLRPSDLVRVATYAMERQLNDRNVDLELFIDREARMVCEMSPKPLRQAVAVLLRNVAIHSRATRVRVSLEARQSNGKLALDLRVEDNGTGVNSVEAEQLFQAFYRHSSDTAGLGLGLSVARTLIEAQGGRIEYFDSHMGGAGFHVHLEPVLGDQRALEQIDLPTKNMDGLRVLLVEDNEPLLRLTAAVLEKAGAQVSTASNGREALDLIEHGLSVDLVLTDIFMPIMDGFELVRALREIEFSRVILGVTAATVGREAERMVEAGADACLSKPLSVESIELAYQRAYNGSPDPKSE